MASLPDRRWSLPTRDELRELSRWVWLLLALAAAMAVLSVVQATTVTFDVVVGALISAGPLAVAAALMYVAPRERLVALAALGFAVPPTVRLVRLFFADGNHLLPGVASDAYITFADSVRDLTSVATDFFWLLTLVAVLCLAFQIGIVRSRAGWLIVGTGLVIAAGVAVAIVVSLPSPERLPELWSIEKLAPSLLGQLPIVAWGYLAAASFDRRLVLLSLAAGVRLAQGLLSLVSFTVFAALEPNMNGDLMNTVNSVVFALWRLLDAALWPLLIAGVLRELARVVGADMRQVAGSEKVNSFAR